MDEIMIDQRFVNLETAKDLLRQQEEINRKIAQIPTLHCRDCGDTKPRNGYVGIWGMAVGDGIYQTSGLLCNRCGLSDEQYEQMFDEPKDTPPDFIINNTCPEFCEHHDEAQGRHLCCNKNVKSMRCQGICENYKDLRK